MDIWELVEGGDSPKKLVRIESEAVLLKSTMSLIWRMNKLLWGTGKMVIVFNGFCVIKGLIGMYDIGVYGSAVAKTCRYRPAGIYGDRTNGNFEKKNR